MADCSFQRFPIGCHFVEQKFAVDKFEFIYLRTFLFFYIFIAKNSIKIDSFSEIIHDFEISELFQSCYFSLLLKN